MDLSIVIPLFNEDESLPELSAWIEKVMLENNFTYEIILIDDGSTDNSWEVIEQLSVRILGRTILEDILDPISGDIMYKEDTLLDEAMVNSS